MVNEGGGSTCNRIVMVTTSAAGPAPLWVVSRDRDAYPPSINQAYTPNLLQFTRQWWTTCSAMNSIPEHKGRGQCVLVCMPIRLDNTKHLIKTREAKVQNKEYMLSIHRLPWLHSTHVRSWHINIHKHSSEQTSAL